MSEWMQMRDFFSVIIPPPRKMQAYRNTLTDDDICHRRSNKALNDGCHERSLAGIMRQTGQNNFQWDEYIGTSWKLYL